MNDRRRFVIAISLVAGAALAGGCARRAHTSPRFGVQNHAYFDRQAAAAARGTAQGLDSEEAAVIHQRYRETIGKRGAQQQRNDPRSSVLILDQGDQRDASKRP